MLPSARVGLESSADLVSYSWHTNGLTSAIQSQGTQWSVGPFTEVQLSQRLRLEAGAGYTVFEPGSGTSLGGRLEGPYANLTLKHRANSYLEYWVRASRALTFNSYSGPLGYYDLAAGANWQLLRKITLFTWLAYQHGTDVAYGSETYDWFGIRMDVSRPITRKLTAQLGYRWYRRLSSLPSDEYMVNVASVNLKYQF